MAKVPADLKVCIFDVFGTVVDWRGSLIEDLPKLGKKYGLDTDWTSFADDWRGLYQPQMARVRKGELPWTRIDDLHKEAFEMLLKKRGLKHPGEEGTWEFTHLWHKLRPWPDSVEGIGMMKKKYVVSTLSNGNVALLINMAKHSGIPWDHCFSGETFHHYKPDPESYLGVVDSMYLKPHQVMLVAAHNGDLKAAHDLETTSYPLWTLDEETVTRLVKEGGIVAPTGKAGGMLMFHGNLVHGSAGNITPYPRKIVYLTLNAVSNYIRTPTRPEYIAHRDFTPIQTVDDDALLRLARAHRQAAE